MLDPQVVRLARILFAVGKTGLDGPAGLPARDRHILYAAIAATARAWGPPYQPVDHNAYAQALAAMTFVRLLDAADDAAAR